MSTSGEFISESGMICGSSDRLVLSGWASDLHGGVLSYEWDYGGPGTVSFFPESDTTISQYYFFQCTRRLWIFCKRDGWLHQC